MPVLAVTRVGRHCRTTIPREVRRLLGVGEGDLVEWVFKDDRVIVRRAGGRWRRLNAPTAATRGSPPDSSSPGSHGGSGSIKP